MSVTFHKVSSGVRTPRLLYVVISLLVATVTIGGSTAPAAAASIFDTRTLPRREVLETALTAYYRVEDSGLLTNKLLTVIDYSLPSSKRRLWVLDPFTLKVLFYEFVAHGRGSTTDEDPDRAIRFGNEVSSLRSSLGTFVTGETYIGKHGNSLNLTGLDPGINDKAEERRIVMHPAQYVSAEFRAAEGGRVGRSWGCPALDPSVAAAVIDRIQLGSVLYVTGEEPPSSRRLAVGTSRLHSARR